MKKKVFSMFLAIMMLCPIITPVYAIEIEKPTIKIPPAMRGVVTDMDGNQYVVEGVLVETLQPQNNGEISATYRYDVPMRAATGSITEEGIDGGYCSRVYLTIYFNRDIYEDNEAVNTYLLTRVSGEWELSVSNTRIESAYLSYTCTSVIPHISQSAFDVEVDNNFNVYTGFTRYVPETPAALVSASLTVNYIMGTTRRWSFTLINELIHVGVV